MMGMGVRRINTGPTPEFHLRPRAVSLVIEPYVSQGSVGLREVAVDRECSLCVFERLRVGIGRRVDVVKVQKRMSVRQPDGRRREIRILLGCGGEGANR